MTENPAITARTYSKPVANVAVGRRDGGEEIRRVAQLDDLELVPKTFLHRPNELLVPAALEERVRAQLPSLNGAWTLQRRDAGHLLCRLDGGADEADLLPPSAPTLAAADRLREALEPDGGVAVNAILCSAALRFYSAPKYQGKDAFPHPVPPPATDQRPQLDQRVRRPVICGIVDTGMARRTDPWLEDAIGRGQVKLDPDDERESPDVIEPTDELDPVAGHGTFIAGEVLWGAPGATVYTVRQGGEGGVVDEDSLVHAIDRLVALADGRLDVLNLSLGGWTENDEEPPYLAAKLRTLIAQDTLVVAAAGNLQSSRPFWPAAMGKVVAVAALATNGSLAPWSNRGDWVNVATRGEQIESTFFDAYSTKVPGSAAPGRLEFHGWGRWAGSSFSAPHVVAAVARRLTEQPGLTPREALEQISSKQKLGSRTRIPELSHAWVLPWRLPVAARRLATPAPTTPQRGLEY